MPMASQIWQGGGLIPDEKVWFTAWVSPVIKKFYQDRNMSASDVIKAHYAMDKANEREGKVQEISRLEIDLAKARADLANIDTQFGKKWSEVAKIYEQYKTQIANGGHPTAKWIAKKLQDAKVLDITPEEFLTHYGVGSND